MRKPLPIGISDFKELILIPKNPKDLGVLMEFKKVDRFKKIDLETAAISALEQIEEKQYNQELLDRGIKRMLFIGFAFEGKEVMMRHKFKT